MKPSVNEFEGFGPYGSLAERQHAPEPEDSKPGNRLSFPSPLSQYGRRLRRHASMERRPELRTYDLRCDATLTDSSLLQSWRRTLSRVALEPNPRHPGFQGLHSLRVAIADYLLRRRNIRCSAEDILIVEGTQQALTLLARLILDVHDTVVIEDPHDPSIARSLLAHGARVRCIPVDSEGLIVRDLPHRSVRLLCTTPNRQFPTGVEMSMARKLDLLRWATKNSTWIMEDSYQAEFTPDKGLVPALRALDKSNRVIYVGHFSRILFPGMSMGYMVCPPGLREELHKAKAIEDFCCSAIEQQALEEFMSSGQYENYLNLSIQELAERRQQAIAGLQRPSGNDFEIGPSETGTHFAAWSHRLTFPDFSAYLNRLAAAGIGIQSAHGFYRAPPPRPGVIIGYAALRSAGLSQAIDIMMRCLR